jgi:hypothetical protein
VQQINEEGQLIETGNSSPVTVLKVDLGKHVSAVALCSALAAASACMCLFAAYTATKAEREARMLQYYVNEVDGKLIHAGFIEPRDRWSPEKRQQYEGEGK